MFVLDGSSLVDNMSKKVLVMLCLAMLFHQERAGFVNDLVFEIRPRDVIYFGDQVNPDLIDIAQTETQAQFISDNNTKVLQDMLGQDLRPNTMLVISTKSAEILADIWKETRQHNFVYATWIIIGPTIAIVEQSVTMYMIGIGNGFSPQMALFFLNQRCRAEGNQSCNITQIIGNGLERPIIKVTLPFSNCRTSDGREFYSLAMWLVGSELQLDQISFRYSKQLGLQWTIHGCVV